MVPYRSHMGCLKLTYCGNETPFLEEHSGKSEAVKLRVWVNPKRDFLGVDVEEADYASTGLNGIQIGMSQYRQSLPINSKIGTFSKFSSTYRILGIANKLTGHLGTAGSALGVFMDYQAMQSGTIGPGRFTYRLGGVGASIVGGAVIGTELGGPYGTLAGTLIGGVSWAGEQSYDGVMWFGDQLSQGMVQTENALNSGWYPGR